MGTTNSNSTIPPEILAFYNRGNKQERLENGIGPIEFTRNQELIERYFPPAPAVVFDIGRADMRVGSPKKAIKLS